MTNLKFISAIAIITATAPLGIFSAKIANADTSNADYLFLVDGAWQGCKQIGHGYQAVRAFETDNHVVNICKKGDSHYYLGETKAERASTIFLPANALESGEMYRANNGNIAYIVSILPNRATLTIERNGGQIAHELSLPNVCLVAENNYDATVIVPSHITKVQILSDYSDVRLSGIETTAQSKFDLGQAFLKREPETVLSLSTCSDLN